MPSINLATWVTLARLFGIPPILWGLSVADAGGRGLALAVFVVAAATDWLDGYLARRLGQVTDLGKFLDPLVDKLLVLAPLLCLVEKGQVPAWGAFLLVARELTIAGWRVNQAQIAGANLWGKAKTVLQIGAISLLILQRPEGVIAFWIAVATTLWSGWLYVRRA